MSPNADPVIPCPVLVGRSREVDALAAAFAGACDGRGGVVFVVGEAGIGKSRLVHEVTALAAARSALVLRGRAVPGATAAPFRPLAEALGAVAAPPGDELGPWLPALAAIVPALGPTGVAGAEASAPVRGEAVVRLLRALCGATGGVLVLEDLHWADPDTVAVVEHLSDNLDRAPVLCVVTVRSDEESDARDLARRVAARRTATVLEPGRLNAAQVAAMVYSCTGGMPPEEVERVLALSDGVPFLVEEMLVSPGLPASFAEGIAQRFAAMPDADRRVLATAAAFGRHFDWRLLPAATDLPERDVVDALDRGVAATLLAVDGDGFRFRHALTAEAVFQSVLPPRRIAHAAAALAALDRAYAELPSGLRDAAAQLAERAGQHERAGRLHLASGAEALARGALHTAALTLTRATRLLPPGEDADAAAERLVAALADAGRLDDARAIGRDVAGRLPAERAGLVHLRLAGAATTAARWDVASAELAAARDLGVPALDGELALREAELAIGTNDVATAEQRAGAALSIARAAGAPELECAALQLLGRCHRRSSLERAEGCFREALRLAEMYDLPLWRLRALHEIGTIGLLDRADVGELVEAQRMAESLGAVATAAILDVELAAGYASAHDLERQERHGHAAVARGSGLGLDLVVAYGWLHVAGVAALRGDGAQAAAASAAGRAAAPGNRDIDGLLVGAAEMVAALVAGDVDAALAAAERGAALLRGSQTAPPAFYRALWPLLLAVRARPDAAAAVAEMEAAGIEVSRPCRAYLAMARALLDAARDPARTEELVVEADASIEALAIWRHLGRWLVAEGAAGSGWTLPEDWLPEAERWLRDHGYPVVADACAALRRGGPHGVPARWVAFGITRREADVLELLAEGRSNREIADALFLSVRTVEKHVESLLRKTSSRTRTQLAVVATATVT